jgi:hypothetical protein
MYSREHMLEVVEKLRRNGFDAMLVDSVEEAGDRILQMIPINATVGVANSVTVRQLGIVDVLIDRGSKVIDPVSMFYGLTPLDEATFMETLLKATFGADVFISGTNALTEDGKIVNIDGMGNRVAGIIFGARTSIVVVGRNKLMKDVDAAIYRIRNTITPAFAQRRKLSLPCAKAGKCLDCNVPERACNITVIIERKPALTDLKVVMVNDDLGLGWDPEWSKENVNRIREKYEQFDWPYADSWNEYKAKFRNLKR